jgi:hypothetical protein
MWENPEYISDKEYKARVQPKWIQYCRNKLDNNPWWCNPGPHVRRVKIEELYQQGRLSGYLELMDFKQFEKKMTKNCYNWYSDRDWKKNYTRRHYKYNRNNGEHFQQNGTEKKVLSEHEQAKREWREFKKVRKDKAKAYWQLGRKSYWTRMGRKCERRFVRQQLQKGNYDFPMDDRAFVNPWDWD